jgi:uncharacterized membrane protein
LTLLDSSTLNRFAQHRRPIVSEWVSEEGEGVTRQMRRLAASVRSDANDVLAELLDPEELEPAIAFVPADPDEGSRASCTTPPPGTRCGRTTSTAAIPPRSSAAVASAAIAAPASSAETLSREHLDPGPHLSTTIA